MNEWQDIETAPKDGTHILGYGPLDSLRGYYIETIYWYPEMPSRWPIEWMTGHGAPTHWQALPAPPPDHGKFSTPKGNGE